MLARFARMALLVLPTLIAAVLAVYAAELYFGVAESDGGTDVGGGEPYDTRHRLEVVQDLRRQGVPAFPAIYPRALMEHDPNGRLRSLIRLRGEEILPLGGISRHTTVTCNESGAYAIYQSDEHGFNNPIGLWRAGALQIAVIGDSFTYGSCVPAEQGFVAGIRRHHPMTLNLGLGDVGPLLELAILREYATGLQPRLVLWVFYEGNDLADLEEERRSDFLMGQLAGDPPQQLRRRQAAVDRALKAFAFERMDEALLPVTPFTQFLRLTHVRQRLYQAWQSSGEAGDGSYDFGLLQRVIARAKTTVASWDGDLVLVYLPGRDRYFAPPGTAMANERIHAGVRGVAQALGIGTIDLVPRFAAQEDPASLFVDANSHLTEAGYAFVADVIVQNLPDLESASPDSAAFENGTTEPTDRRPTHGRNRTGWQGFAGP